MSNILEVLLQFGIRCIQDCLGFILWITLLPLLGFSCQFVVVCYYLVVLFLDVLVV